MKILQRLAYINLGIYPFTSFFLTIYCLLPAFSVISGHLIVNFQSETYLTYLLIMTVTLCMLAILEVKWSNITLEEYWRNEQFWLLEATSSHLAAVLQGFLKALGGIEISFTVTGKSAVDDSNSTQTDEFADLDIVKWTPLMIPPILIIAINVIGIAVGFSRYAYSTKPELGKLIGAVFFSFWVLAHLYPFVEGLKGKGRMPTIVYIWAGLIVVTISQLCGLNSDPHLNTKIEFGG